MPEYFPGQQPATKDAMIARPTPLPFQQVVIAIAAMLILALGTIQTAVGAASTNPQEPDSNLELAEPGSEITSNESAPDSTTDSPLQPASVVVDFSATQGQLLRTERIHTWDNGDPVPELRDDDAAFLNEEGLRDDLVRIGFGFDDLCDVMDTGSGCHGQGGGETMSDLTTKPSVF